MNKLVKVIDPVKDSRWDKFVQEHPFGWVCHLSGWKQVLEDSFRHIKGYFLVIQDKSGRNIKAGLPIYLVKSWLTGSRLVSIPFATLSDPLISSSDEMEELIESILSLKEESNSSYVEIRTLMSAFLVQDKRLRSTQFFKHHYLNLEDELEKLKKRFHRSCVRQRISKAIRNSLSIQVGKSTYDLKEFYRLHLITRKRLSLPAQPFHFFERLWKYFGESGKIEILLAKNKNKSISGLILFKFKKRVSVEFLVSDNEFWNQSPNHFLIWEAIKRSHKEGYNVFDFGRTSPNNKGLMDFKRHWGTMTNDFHQFFYPKNRGERIANIEKSWQYKTIKNLCGFTPGFMQQTIGNFCYRHLG